MAAMRETGGSVTPEAFQVLGWQASCSFCFFLFLSFLKNQARLHVLK